MKEMIMNRKITRAILLERLKIGLSHIDSVIEELSFEMVKEENLVPKLRETVRAVKQIRKAWDLS